MSVLAAEAEQIAHGMTVDMSIDQIEVRQCIELGAREIFEGCLAGGAVHLELFDLGVPAQHRGEDAQRRAVRLADPDGVDRVQGADGRVEQTRLLVERMQGILEAYGDTPIGLVTACSGRLGIRARAKSSEAR